MSVYLPVTWIIFIDDRICYTEKLGVIIIIQFFQRNGKLPLPQLQQDNYPLIPIYESMDAIFS